MHILHTAAALGTYKNGVSLTESVGFASDMLNQKHGMISFWIKPNWNGNDNTKHIFLKVGDPTSNGILIEKSSQNTLRFVMAGGNPVKVASSRVDVSNWQAERWYHIACTWVTVNNKPLGLGLWIDHVCVDSVIYGGTAFMNPNNMADKNIYIGDTSSHAVMDELIIRNDVIGTYGPDQISMVYRDYFRTAPYTQIKIDPDPNCLPSDPRVVLNAQKQFGLKALRQEGDWERITNFDVRYHQWSDFDAKPFISWSVHKTNIATVDNTIDSFRRGLVTGKAVGTTMLGASFRGMTATYSLNVIPWNQPDLDLMYVERYPKYSWDGTRKWPYEGSFLTPEPGNGKKRPDEGETVTSVAHYGNYGFQPSPTSKIRFELVSDDNENFVLDDTDTVKYSTEEDVESLDPNTTATKTFTWTWPSKSQGEHPVFVRVTLDSDNTVNEICEANNQRCELNIAQAYLWRYDAQLYENDYKTKQINHIGSFSTFDWTNAQVDRLSQLLREAVLPTTSPIGIKDAIRVDYYFAQTTPSWDNEPYKYYYDSFCDDWFAGREPEFSTLLDFDPAMDHELVHGLETPDLYGHPHNIYNVFLKDQNGQPYAGTQLYPTINEGGTGMLPGIPIFDQTDMLGFGYDTMMCSCHWWLDRYIAGMIHRTAGKRDKKDRGCDAVTGCPTTNKLLVLDINDQPLKNAALYAYQLTEPIFDQDDLSGSKYVPDRPKFMGNVDADGYWIFPNVTDPTWDDLETDTVEGSMSIRNPFHVVNREFEPPWYCFGGYFILKIVGANNQVEFRTISQIELWDAYMSGDTNTAVYTIKTNLTPSESPVEIVKPIIPDAIKTTNQKPVAVITSDLPVINEWDDDGTSVRAIYVKPGQSFTLDGSTSYDPEGQPLIYRWVGFGENYAIYPPFSTSATRRYTAPMEVNDYRYQFYVLDGLRFSKPIRIKVRVKNLDNTPPVMNYLYDEGDVTYKNSSLYAYWSATASSGSAIAEYKYAIGTNPTDPGSGYIRDWTSTGLNTNITAVGLNLTIGQTYYFYVKAASNSGVWSDVLATDGIQVLQDTTPPKVEMVNDYSSVTCDNTKLSAYWWANDPYPYSSIEEYRYAVGTSPTDPGSGYFKDWTSTGYYSSAELTGLNLTVGQTYYFYVKALNGAGLWSNVVASDGIKVLPPPTIGEAKLLPTQTPIILSDVVVSTSFMSYPNGCIYVQSPDKSAGIMVMTGSYPYKPGMILDLSGKIYTYNGEPYFSYPTITVKGTTTVTPLGLNNASIGGSNTGLQEATIGWRWIKKEDGTSEYKMLSDYGLNNVGLLVKTTGKVTYVDPAGNFAYIDDGSHADDGNTLGPDGISIKGIRISLQYDSQYQPQYQYKMPPVGSYVAVIGISGIRYDNGCKSTILLRSQDDIMSISGAMISGKITTTTTTDQLIESPHPCPDNYSDSWHIVGPAGIEKMRLHFTKIEVTNYNTGIYGSLYYQAPGGYSNGLSNSTDIWTNWVLGNAIDLNISWATGLYGFQMDKFEAIVPVEGVEITLMPGNITATTDANGYFIFGNLAPGSYTVTPSLDGVVFDPFMQTITVNPMQAVVGVDFTIY
jgi:hypothetical protein